SPTGPAERRGEWGARVPSPLARKPGGRPGGRGVRRRRDFTSPRPPVFWGGGVVFSSPRQRVSERLAEAGNYLPKGVTPYLAPDATALGQIFWYTVEPDPNHPIDPPRLWALNKFYIAPQLNAASRVAQVAPLRGAPPEYPRD